MISSLVVNKYATLAEIRDVYSIEEVLDLYELCLVDIYNKYQASKAIQSRR